MPEVITCPSCTKQLRVPDSLLGKGVKCPTCGATFMAPVATQPRPGVAPPEPTMPEPRYEQARRPYRETEEYDEFDEYDPRPRRRRIHRNREMHRGGLVLGLGISGVVLTFAVCPMVGPMLGIPAWIMGNADLAKMQAGTMDAEGEGLTNGGRICGIIATILGILLTCGGGLLIALILANDPNAFKNM